MFTQGRQAGLAWRWHVMLAGMKWMCKNDEEHSDWRRVSASRFRMSALDADVMFRECFAFNLSVFTRNTLLSFVSPLGVFSTSCFRFTFLSRLSVKFAYQPTCFSLYTSLMLVAVISLVNYFRLNFVTWDLSYFMGFFSCFVNLVYYCFKFFRSRPSRNCKNVH